jgi:hypothetical protein
MGHDWPGTSRRGDRRRLPAQRRGLHVQRNDSDRCADSHVLGPRAWSARLTWLECILRPLAAAVTPVLAVPWLSRAAAIATCAAGTARSRYEPSCRGHERAGPVQHLTPIVAHPLAFPPCVSSISIATISYHVISLRPRNHIHSIICMSTHYTPGPNTCYIFLEFITGPRRICETQERC